MALAATHLKVVFILIDDDNFRLQFAQFFALRSEKRRLMSAFVEKLLRFGAQRRVLVRVNVRVVRADDRRRFGARRRLQLVDLRL